MILDKYNREITDSGNGIFSTDGIEVISEGSVDKIINIFNSMPPLGWLPEVERLPLDATGALATLLVVTNTLAINDAANAVGLFPEDLIFEAESWAAAQDINY